MAQLGSVCTGSESLLPFLALGWGSLPAPFLAAKGWSNQQKVGAHVGCRGLWCGEGEGEDLGLLWSQEVGEGGNRCLILGEVLNPQLGKGGSKADPPQHLAPPVILCCVVRVA